MENKIPFEGKYITFRGKPLVRENNIICYGNMEDKYYLFLMILTNKKVDYNQALMYVKNFENAEIRHYTI